MSNPLKWMLILDVLPFPITKVTVGATGKHLDMILTMKVIRSNVSVRLKWRQFLGSLRASLLAMM